MSEPPVMRWKDEPVTANEPGGEKKWTCAEEILIIGARPDSSISEFEVWFDEGGDRTLFVFAYSGDAEGGRLHVILDGTA